MKYCVFVPLGYSSAWLARELISPRHEIEPAESRYADVGSKTIDMGAYTLPQIGIVVYPTSPGFVDEGGLLEWSRKYVEKATNIIGLGWCGSRREDVLGRIVVPEYVALSPSVKQLRPIAGDGNADRRLRTEIIRGLDSRGYGTVEGSSCTYLGLEDSVVPGMAFGDMEAGLLMRHGNNHNIPTACVYVVSDDTTESLDKLGGEKHERVASSFFDRILSEPYIGSYTASLESALDVLRQK